MQVINSITSCMEREEVTLKRLEHRLLGGQHRGPEESRRIQGRTQQKREEQLKGSASAEDSNT